MFKRLRTTLGGWVGGSGGDDEAPEARAPRHDGSDAARDEFMRFGNKSVAVWDAETGVATVVRTRGKVMRAMGTAFGGAQSLFPEEALFLVERGQLVVVSASTDAEGLASPEMYARCVLRVRGGADAAGEAPRAAKVPLLCYWVYAHLLTLGYVAFRPYAHLYGLSGVDSVLPPRVWDDAAAADGADAADGASAAAVDGAADAADGAPALAVAAAAPLAVEVPLAEVPLAEVPLAFEVHQPTAAFSKRRMGKPSFYVFVSPYAGDMPSVPRLAALLERCGSVPLKAAVVACDGTVLMFDVSAGIS
ncbi:hypothetical protein M885DRAFT_476867 [Pelagophyceae sp. CCMP2097]|nr:hypothetical protein M885DRAFT_476867 [Pelagophyceae sp. CCMP2097]